VSNLEAFMDDPWNSTTMHGLYLDSLIQIKPAPEVVTGEILLASVYRIQREGTKLIPTRLA
jgi:hypothetical protein